MVPTERDLTRRSVFPCAQLEDMRKNEDPRLSFSTPEFKEAQRIFTDGFKVRGWYGRLLGKEKML